MSIDKWLSEKDSKEERIRREKAFKRLTKDEVQELKKKKIRDVVKKEVKTNGEISESDKILQEIVEFKDWLNQRTYLKGDLDKIETWIRNLYSTINYESEKKVESINHNEKKELIEKYREIPISLLDENTRVAINKKIRGTNRTNSDNYYLRKLKKNIQEKLKEAEYYETLDKILKIS
ncbi:MAG: hypothetical protein JSV23_04840 [Promethearchaeota archaeon]|nr:MAG: hypothetical protein JSV23_04840 [Candidatus Lokiarchaeota archaeon]